MIFLGLGSNLSSSYGDRFKNINLAMSKLKSKGIKIVKKSSYYETPSYPDVNNPKFINIVIGITTDFTPIDLASLILLIEEQLERKRNKKNDPRTCDIDIIDYNNQILDFKYNDFHFYVPHKKLSNRNFVLIPIREIFPKWRHPKTKDLITNLIKKLPNEDKKSILKVKKY